MMRKLKLLTKEKDGFIYSYVLLDGVNVSESVKSIYISANDDKCLTAEVTLECKIDHNFLPDDLDENRFYRQSSFPDNASLKIEKPMTTRKSLWQRLKGKD